MSNGMMEWWNNGMLGFKNGIYPGFSLYFISFIEKRFILLNPSFQPSDIPSFHIIGLRHSYFCFELA